MTASITRAQRWSVLLGNLFEHYDTALFSVLSPFLAPLFFPNQDKITALIFTYAIIPLGMLVKPLGALVFGYIGDRYGRAASLRLTLSGMALVSGGMALCPTYTQIGPCAPVLLCLGRMLQNFLASGETIGGALFLMENSSEKKSDILSSLFNASTLAGILIASAGVAVLNSFSPVEQSWRYLYVLGCTTALWAFCLRRGLPSIEGEVKNDFSTHLLKLIKTLWECRNTLLLISIVSGFAYANYIIALVFLNGFIPLISSLTKHQMTSLNTALLGFDFAILPLMGWVASKFSREKFMVAVTAITASIAIPAFSLLKDASLMQVVTIRVLFIVLGVAFFAPFHAWAKDLLPKDKRYLVISFGYALGSQLLGGPTASLSLWLFKKTETPYAASVYWIALAALSGSLLLLNIYRQRFFYKVTHVKN